MKDYTVVFNSRKFATGAVRNDLTYQFDWSQFPDDDYYVSFTYIGEANHLTAVSTAQVHINLGGTMYAFETATTNNANRSLYIGNLRFISGAAVSFEANTNQNSPIYLKGRPTNQSPRIQILDGAGLPFLDASANPPANYVLAVRFERLYRK